MLRLMRLGQPRTLALKLSNHLSTRGHGRPTPRLNKGAEQLMRPRIKNRTRQDRSNNRQNDGRGLWKHTQIGRLSVSA